MKTTKKGISSLLKRKKKTEKEASANTTSCPPESEFPQIPEISSTPENITCPNNRCGKVFDKPLELIDLAKPSEQGAHVCPYCLTKLESAQLEPELEPELEQEAVPETSDEKFQDVEEPKEVEPKEEKCPQFLGYLSKRPKDAPIPEFCLTCPQMMECMHG